ncbi:MAG: DUF748 domain-containing protein [Pseudomonadales bacterium]|nr:DUF748 domain-containing protein [Pseudomonadales bacterium]
MSLSGLWKKMTGWQRSLLISTFSIALYALLGFIAVPHILQKQLVEQLSPITDRAVAVGEIKFNPFLLILSIKDFAIESKNPEQPIRLLAWKELYVDFEVSSLFHLAWTFKEVRWLEPKLYIELHEGGRFSFDDIIDRVSLGDEDSDTEVVEDAEAGIPAIRMEKFLLSDAAFRFKDESRDGDNLLVLSPISFAINGFSTEVDTEDANDYSLKLVGKKGGSLEWDGNFSLRPVSSKGRIKLSNIDLSQFVDFYKDQLNFTMPTALLSFETDYDLFNEPDWGVALTHGQYSIKDLKLVDNLGEQVLLELPELKVTGVNINSIQQQATIEKVSFKNSFAQLQQYKDGSLNIDRALDFSAFSVTEEAKTISQGDVALSELSSVSDSAIKADTTAIQSSAETKDWYWRVDEIEFESMVLDFEEQSQKNAVKMHLSDFNAVLKNLHSDSRENVAVSLQAKLNGAPLKITADGGLMPLSLRGGVDLDGFALQVVQPYVDPIAKVTINKGTVSISLKYAVSEAVDKESEASFDKIQISGNLSVDGLSIKGGRKNREVIAWRSMALTSFDFDVLENKLLVDVLSWSKPYIRAELLKDGSINFDKMLLPRKLDKNPKANAQGEDKGFVLSIKKQTIKNGKIYFADRTLSPNYVTSLDAISGYSTGISNVAGKASKLSLKAKVDGHAPVEIKGYANFMIEKPTLDMDILFKAVEMTSFTPYSGTYMGYKVKQGQISLTLNYSLKNDYLVGKNNIYINQFDFGDKVESEQATSLPVKLAVALLEDKNNKIDLDVDIEGDVNDPDFSVKGLIWKVLKNIVMKAISSPFSLLAGLAGSDDELNIVQFSAGSTVMSEEALARLAILSQALKDRPKLNLSVMGGVDPITDLAALKDQQLHVDVLMYLHEKGKKASKQGVLYQYPLPLDDKAVRKGFETLFASNISDEKSDALDKKLDLDRQDKTSEESSKIRFDVYMQALLALEVVEEQALIDLAYNRVLEVKKTLVDVNTIAAERIFITQADLSDAHSAAQVLLNLQ